MLLVALLGPFPDQKRFHERQESIRCAMSNGQYTPLARSTQRRQAVSKSRAKARTVEGRRLKTVESSAPACENKVGLYDPTTTPHPGARRLMCPFLSTTSTMRYLW